MCCSLRGVGVRGDGCRAGGAALGHIKAVSGEPTSWSLSPSCQLRGHEDHGFDVVDVRAEARTGAVAVLGALSLAAPARTQQHRPPVFFSR